MAGMIYDANQSLNWIMDDPNMVDTFRNSSMIGTGIMASSTSGNKSFNKPQQKSIRRSTQLTPQKENKPLSQNKKHDSSTSLANLFSDDEEQELLGIAFFTIWEAGIMISGYGGTGVVLSRNIMTGDWSGPVAVRVSGVGAGLLAGASVKTIVYLIYDYFTLKSIIGSDGGLIFKFGTGATVGTWTRDSGKQSAYITSPKMLRTAGMGQNVALCRGLAGIYGAVSIEAGICKSRDKINAMFYGKENLTAEDILLSGVNPKIPSSSTADGKTVSNYQAKRLMERVHTKLKTLFCRNGTDHNIINNNDNNNSDNNDVKQNGSSEDLYATLEELYSNESYDIVYDDEYETSIPLDEEKPNGNAPLFREKTSIPIDGEKPNENVPLDGERTNIPLDGEKMDSASPSETEQNEDEGQNDPGDV